MRFMLINGFAFLGQNFGRKSPLRFSIPKIPMVDKAVDAAWKTDFNSGPSALKASVLMAGRKVQHSPIQNLDTFMTGGAQSQFVGSMLAELISRKKVFFGTELIFQLSRLRIAKDYRHPCTGFRFYQAQFRSQNNHWSLLDAVDEISAKSDGQPLYRGQADTDKDWNYSLVDGNQWKEQARGSDLLILKLSLCQKFSELMGRPSVVPLAFFDGLMLFSTLVMPWQIARAVCIKGRSHYACSGRPPAVQFIKLKTSQVLLELRHRFTIPEIPGLQMCARPCSSVGADWKVSHAKPSLWGSWVRKYQSSHGHLAFPSLQFALFTSSPSSYSSSYHQDFAGIFSLYAAKPPASTAQPRPRRKRTASPIDLLTAACNGIVEIGKGQEPRAEEALAV
ncbi:hypothetical protein HPP92_028714 [Vanilla planifolia]|uniref:Uncharacterized protein n=1 Tax=Vanilla planifolia TaxID=51239 RepID=A0A835P4R8_VANPL|nr:hypothetical protein HPP92_028714 [Vanilla planifolia]KAG0446706.1 hypothetical protein HPP92_028697 [Vanilla planifolia]